MSAVDPLSRDLEGAFIRGFTNAGGEVSSRFSSFYSLAGIASSALFIIGCLGAAGKFPARAMGPAVASLAGGSYLSNLAAGNLSNRKFELITMGLASVTMLVLGILAGKGTLSMRQAGLGVVLTCVTVGVISCYAAASAFANRMGR